MGRRLGFNDLKVVSGEWWYAMNDEGGKPFGYCHYTAKTAADRSVRVEWQLRLAFPGGTYEEDRSMDLDGGLRMKAASYAVGDERCAGQRDGKQIAGTHKAPPAAEGKGEFRIEVPDDALPGMDFVMASWLPLEAGARLEYSGVNEADGFKSLGPVVLDVVGREAASVGGKEVQLWRVNRTVVNRKDGHGTLPLWLDDQHRIVRADWGGGNVMALSDKPTTHLLRARK